jgi:hypothetical protein
LIGLNKEFIELIGKALEMRLRHLEFVIKTLDKLTSIKYSEDTVKKTSLKIYLNLDKSFVFIHIPQQQIKYCKSTDYCDQFVIFSGIRC